MPSRKASSSTFAPRIRIAKIPGRLLVHVEIAGRVATGDRLSGVQQNGDDNETLWERDPGPLEDGAGMNIETALATLALSAAGTTLVLLAGNLFFATVSALRLAVPAEKLEMVDASLVNWIPFGQSVRRFVMGLLVARAMKGEIADECRHDFQELQGRRVAYRMRWRSPPVISQTLRKPKKLWLAKRTRIVLHS